MKQLSSELQPWCKNCLKINRACASHQVYLVNCKDCLQEFEGSARTKRCKMCTMKRTRGLRYMADGPTKLIASICSDCGQQYQGAPGSKRCDPCQAESVAKRKREEYQRFRANGQGHQKKQTSLLPKAKPVAPKVCKDCVYCVEDERSEIGMQCTVYAFMRCQPYSLGAKPLKRREDERLT